MFHYLTKQDSYHYPHSSILTHRNLNQLNEIESYFKYKVKNTLIPFISIIKKTQNSLEK